MARSGNARDQAGTALRRRAVRARRGAMGRGLPARMSAGSVCGAPTGMLPDLRDEVVDHRGLGSARGAPGAKIGFEVRPRADEDVVEGRGGGGREHAPAADDDAGDGGLGHRRPADCPGEHRGEGGREVVAARRVHRVDGRRRAGGRGGRVDVDVEHRWSPPWCRRDERPAPERTGTGAGLGACGGRALGAVTLAREVSAPSADAARGAQAEGQAGDASRVCAQGHCSHSLRSVRGMPADWPSLWL